ncbi:MAG: histidine kinase dimerization/phospho-acceptor domain-containing protein, partial [Terriglobales bacterium]
MPDPFAKLPTVILLGVLVVIFAALLKQNRTFHFRLWFIGWAILFLRFLLQMVWRPLGLPQGIYAAVDLSALQIAGIIFMVSVSQLAETKYRDLYLLYFGGATTIYAFCLTNGVTSFWAYLGIMLFMSVIPTFALLRVTGLTAVTTIMLGSAWATIVWSLWRAYQGRPDLGFYAFMTWIYGASALLFYRKYQRLTPGIVTTSIGFLGWAAVGPLGYFVHYMPLSGQTQSALWDLPKFVVAIGMIVTLLEDERIAAEVARERERKMSEQMRRFADLTSHLFSGAEVREVCAQITQAITETSDFRRAVLVLAEGPNRYTVAGQAGFDPVSLQKVSGCVATLTDDSFLALARAESRIGTNSYRAKSHYDVMKILPVAAETPWGEDHKVVIPLAAPGRGVIGAMGLDEPRGSQHITADRLTTLELLATDIAGALDNSKLQQQLFRSEKLAGMGQLVTGVAHELNNPLTAILGYSEILGDRAADAGMKRDLDVMRREALRMKRIIENLQRFSRQQRSEKKQVELGPILGDILKLRAYDMHALKIRVSHSVPSQTMRVFADETLLH